MKNIVFTLIILAILVGCNSAKDPIANKDQNVTEKDTVRIANEELEYEIIIIEPGFNAWLMSIAKPEGYYTQEFMEGRNRLYVLEWNQRVLNPRRFGELYQLQIDYNSNIDYGYEVNYKLYNYFIYFQRQYNQRLAGFIPRI